MGEYLVRWYEGSTEKEEDLIEEFKVSAKDMEDAYDKAVEYVKNRVKMKIYYTRALLYKADYWVIDYGSHSKFISIQKLSK